MIDLILFILLYQDCIKEMVSNEAETIEIISSYMKSKVESELLQMNLKRIGSLFQKKESDSKELKKSLITAKVSDTSVVMQ